MKKSIALSFALAAAAFAVSACADSAAGTSVQTDFCAVLHGVDTWAGLPRSPAVVNPVGREDSPYVISLRGEWDFITQPKPFVRRYRHTKVPFAKVDENTPKKRASSMDRTWSEAIKLRVPGCWESQGVGEPGMSIPWDPLWDCSPKPINHLYMGEGWYRKDVEIPASWAGRKIWIKVGGIRSQGWIWVNKKPVAWIDNYCGTYKYDITEFAKPGATNRITICVDNRQPSRKGLMSNVHRWGGIYRDIELEATPQTYIDDAWVRGDFDAREAELHVKVGGSRLSRPEGDGRDERVPPTDAPYRIRFTVEGQTVELPIPQSQNLTLRLPLADFRPWSPEHPNLYLADIALVDASGAVIQSRRERFGVRKFEVRGEKFYLNGRPYFLRGFGDDSVYPISGMPPADREAHLAHLRKARAAGFNFVRLHTHCEVPEYFEAADETGIMIQAELPYYTDVPTEAFEFDPLRDLHELYEHYRRYVSFCVYCGGNEGRLGPYVGREMLAFVKANDPDRLVNHQDGDRCAWLECDDDEGSNDPDNSDYDVGPRDVWPRGSFRTGRPFVCHEYLNLCVKQDTRLDPLYTGAWAAPDRRADREKWLAERGLDMAWGDALQDAQHTLQSVYQKRGLEAARKDPYCGGYCFWTIVDVVVANGAIHSAQGLFDPFWQTKRGGFEPEDFAKFNSMSCVLLDVPGDRYVFTSGDALDLDVIYARYGQAPVDAATARVTLRRAGGEATVAEALPLARDAGDETRFTGRCRVEFPAVDKAEKVELRVEAEGTSNSWSFYVFPKRPLRDGRGLAADATLLPALSKLYSGVSDAAARADGVRTVIAPWGSKTATDALAAGLNVLTVSGMDAKPNVSLGWWSMGNQVGAAVDAANPLLARLPPERALTPLLFDVVKDGGLELSRKEVAPTALVIVGEGKKECYLYLGELSAERGRHVAAFGLDLFDGGPAGAAILDGIMDELDKIGHEKENPQ